MTILSLNKFNPYQVNKCLDKLLMIVLPERIHSTSFDCLIFQKKPRQKILHYLLKLSQAFQMLFSYIFDAYVVDTDFCLNLVFQLKNRKIKTFLQIL